MAILVRHPRNPNTYKDLEFLDIKEPEPEVWVKYQEFVKTQCRGNVYVHTENDQESMWFDPNVGCFYTRYEDCMNGLSKFYQSHRGAHRNQLPIQEHQYDRFEHTLYFKRTQDMVLFKLLFAEDVTDHNHV